MSHRKPALLRVAWATGPSTPETVHLATEGEGKTLCSRPLPVGDHPVYPGSLPPTHNAAEGWFCKRCLKIGRGIETNRYTLPTRY
jgi:hypothetical protein